MVVRARQVISRSPSRVVYKFPSIKLRRMVYCESSLELNYAYLLDSDHGVSSFQEQPGKIKYFINDKVHSYTPDFLANRPQKKQVVEVKLESKITTKENLILFEAIAPICRQAGYEFVVITDVEIRKQPKLDNIKLFWRYGRTPIYSQHQVYCQEFFTLKHEAELGELFEFFANRKEGRAVIYSLLYWGVVGIDINKSVNPDSVVHMPI